MEENMAKFLEKLKELVALGKKKKSVLELQEINDFFADMELDSDQMEKVFEYLESNNIDVLRISDDDDIDDVDIMISENIPANYEEIWVVARNLPTQKMGNGYFLYAYITGYFISVRHLL